MIGQENLARERSASPRPSISESRSEPEEGQAAVAQVILNRSRPASTRRRSAASSIEQASVQGLPVLLRLRGKSLRITDRESWARASRVADAVLGGETWLADVGGSTHYHAITYARAGPSA